MKILLIPSRHIIHSKDHVRLIHDTFAAGKYDKVVFAITSYNLNNCKYSPVPLLTRVNFIDALIFELKSKFEFSFTIVNVPHYKSDHNYIPKIIKHVEVESGLELNKDNTEVIALGASIANLFRKSEYNVHYSECIGHVELLEALLDDNDDKYFYDHISDSSKYVLENRTEILSAVENIWHDTILKEMGSLTDNRDYNIYTRDMSNAAIIEVKYNDIKNYIVEGKIVDEGCADAMLFAPISRDYPDSDLIGVDISNDFIARANENIRRGIYGGSFVTILQANLLYNNFKPSSINTFICNSTMHEIWSYNNKLESVNNYLSAKYGQLEIGGRIIIRDVIGPEDKSRVVLLRNIEEGGDANFEKFMSDFKHLSADDTYEKITINNLNYYKIRMKCVAEYLLHKDYRSNWNSEMCEEFCHFNIADWQNIAKDNNFKLVTANAYLSDWIKSNRYDGRVEIMDAETMNILDFPNTNAVIVMEK